MGKDDKRPSRKAELEQGRKELRENLEHSFAAMETVAPGITEDLKGLQEKRKEHLPSGSGLGVCPACRSALSQYSSRSNEVPVFVHDGWAGPGTGRNYCMRCVSLAVKAFTAGINKIMGRLDDVYKKRMVIQDDVCTIYNDDGSVFLSQSIKQIKQEEGGR